VARLHFPSLAGGVKFRAPRSDLRNFMFDFSSLGMIAQPSFQPDGLDPDPGFRVGEGYVSGVRSGGAGRKLRDQAPRAWRISRRYEVWARADSSPSSVTSWPGGGLVVMWA
jgi:hypothetical protein